VSANLPPQLSIVTTTDPVAKQLPKLLSALAELARERHLEMEVIVVDDLGQWRESGQPPADAFPPLALKVLTNNVARGQENAILGGLSQARAPVLLTLDPDMHPCVPELPDLLALLGDNCCLVHGARAQRQALSLFRRISSRLANRLFRVVTGLAVDDIGSPVTLITRAALDALPPLDGSPGRNKLFAYSTLKAQMRTYYLKNAPAPGVQSEYSLPDLIGVFIKLLRDSIDARRAARR